MFKIGAVIISLILICAIGFFIWATLSSHKSEHQERAGTTTDRKFGIEDTSEVLFSPPLNSLQAPVTTQRSVVEREAAIQQVDAPEAVIGGKLLVSTHEVVSTVSSSEMSSPLALKPVPRSMLIDLRSLKEDDSHNAGKITQVPEEISVSSRSSVSDIDFPLSNMEPSMLTTISSSSEEEYVSNMGGSVPKSRERTTSSRGGTSNRGSRSGGDVFDDHGNSRDSATEISIGDSVSGEINPRGDEDYFVFDANKGDKIIFDVSADVLGSPLDTVLTLYDSNGRQVAYDDDDGDSFDSYLEYQVSRTGQYYLKVRAFARRGGPGNFYDMDTKK